MTVRSRLKVEVTTGWRRENFSPHTVNTRSYQSLSETCEDVVGPTFGDNQPFTVTRVTRSGGLISGKEKSNLTGYDWHEYPCAYMSDSWLISHLSVPGQPTNGSLATQLLARTQPFRAEAVAWEYLSDLHEMGKRAEYHMADRLRKLSRVVPKSAWRTLRKAAKLNLLYQFGIVPLISDIEVLLSFQRRVDKRVDEIGRLYQKRGLRRTVDLWDGSNTATDEVATIQSQGLLLHAKIIKTTTVKVRGHVRWRAIFPVQKTDAQLRSMAKRAILGTDLDPYVLYELMPWSWLADYFVNLGSMVKAAKNMFTVTHESVRIMTHRRTTTRSTHHDWYQSGTFKVVCSPMTASQETKDRSIASPTLNAQESILTNGQLSILGSLAVLRY